MIYPIDETHDPKLESWVESANDPESDFPIQNLPLGLFTLRYVEGMPRIGVAIGDCLLDLTAVSEDLWAENFHDIIADACSYESLEWMMILLDPKDRRELRRRLSRMLRDDASGDERDSAEAALYPLEEIQLLRPAEIGDYTDFYASIHHATNVGRLFRPDQPLLPNYKWIPIGYHGRASSIVPSGETIPRPHGQTMEEGAAVPSFGPTKALDYELEVGMYIAHGNRSGSTIPITAAEEHIFGFSLVNDWSARDLQRWEYQPLGPFLSKSFATTVSPWIVTAEALAPFRAPAFERAAGDPQPLPYLNSPLNRRQGAFDITLEVLLRTARMREQKLEPHRLSMSNTQDLYWTFAQMLTHHASNGCNLNSGDLLASGTVSGPAKENAGCLLELTQKGADPVQLPGGETRRFLENGDEVIFRGYCVREGYRRIGFGECQGIIES
jgi:fumarylacetoacetase